jgi:hypothetical protein
MSRMTTFSEENELTEFAKKAANNFEENPDHATYSVKYPAPGELLAIRWGMGNDCVLVLKLDEYFEPVIFQQAIKRKV